MTSRKEWHVPVQEEVDWLRQFLFENISLRELHECI